MGFIEDERRKALGIEAQRRHNELLEQQEQETYRRMKEEMKAEGERIGALGKKAKQQFEQSGLGNMIRELKVLNSHKGAYDIAFGGIHKVYIIVDNGAYENDKSIEIETDADGTIKIQGGRNGSTTISREEWQRDGNAMENALGMAYKHPIVGKPERTSSDMKHYLKHISKYPPQQSPEKPQQ